jgi:hypothetical protein
VVSCLAHRAISCHCLHAPVPGLSLVACLPCLAASANLRCCCCSRLLQFKASVAAEEEAFEDVPGGWAGGRVGGWVGRQGGVGWLSVAYFALARPACSQAFQAFPPMACCACCACCAHPAEEFEDPLLGGLMRDPVQLPSGGWVGGWLTRRPAWDAIVPCRLPCMQALSSPWMPWFPLTALPACHPLLLPLPSLPPTALPLLLPAAHRQHRGAQQHRAAAADRPSRPIQVSRPGQARPSQARAACMSILPLPLPGAPACHST